MSTNVEIKTLEEIAQLAINILEEGYNGEVCELHNTAYNESYFIIGRYAAEQWLIKNGGIFNAIDKIKEYEQENFGEVITDLSEPEKICNMYTYILGEEILSECKIIQNNWDKEINKELKAEILKELENIN